MYKVLIVDDEKNIRDRLVQFFPWSDLGFEVIGSCENGQTAMELIKQTHPNAVLTDVLMPKMSGLDLAKELKAMYPEIKVIILSAYDDFKYAQKAIQYGVKGYLLKPLIKKDFLNVFNNIAYELNEELKIKQWGSQNDRCKKQEFFLLDLIKGNNLQHYIDDEKWTGAHNRVVVFSFDRMFKDNTTFSIRETITKHAIYFWKRYDSPPILCYGNCIILLVIGRKAVFREFLEPKIQKFTYFLRDFLKELDIKEDVFVVGIGNVVRKINEISQSYNEAVYAYSYKYFYDQASIIFYEDLPKLPIDTDRIVEKNNIGQQLNSLETSIIESVFTREIKDIPVKVDNYFRNFNTMNGVQIGEIRSACAELFIMLMFRLKEKGFEHLAARNQEALETIYYIDSLKELKKWFRYTLEAVLYDMIENEHDVNHYVLRAKEYVNHHYKEKITLIEIANKLFLHQAYFSSIFKRETGQNFIDYVNEVRVEKAVEILRNTDVKIKDISYMVGFQSSAYFNKVFKNIKNISPLKFRKQLIRN